MAAVLLLPVLGACQMVSDIDSAMRRVDVLDRVFGSAPAPTQPAGPEIVVQPQPAPQEPAWRTAEPAEPAEMYSQIPPEIPKDPRPPTLEAATAAPAPAAATDPATRRAALLRQNPWITGFWGQLSTSQKGWVTRRMQRGGATLASDSVAVAWDRMGLAERVQLLFGDGA
jgi:hypothetical protein